MSRERDGQRWSVGRLLGLEVALRGARGADEGVQVSAGERAVVAEATAAVQSPAERRQVGLGVWLERRLREDSSLAATVRRVDGVMRMIGLVLLVLALLAGWGVLSGVMDHELSAFHVVYFLAATVGWQWLLLLVGLVLWPFRGSLLRGLSAFEGMVGWLLHRFGGERVSADLWHELKGTSGSFGEVFGWSGVAKSQLAMVGYHVGLVASFLGMLSIHDVRFYWKTTFGEGSAGVLAGVVEWLAVPWAWAWPAAAPSPTEVAASELTLGSEQLDVVSAMEPQVWWPFLLMVVVVWGLVPRLLLWGYACWRLRRAKAQVEFVGRRHGQLWRELSRVSEAQVAVEQVNDGAILVDWAGCGVELEQVRGVGLRQLRVELREVVALGLFDLGEDEAAWEKFARLLEEGEWNAVVWCVEGWELVPGEVRSGVERLLGLVDASALRVVILVVGAVQGAVRTSPSGEELRAWEDFVDAQSWGTRVELKGLRDGAAVEESVKSVETGVDNE